MSKQNTLPNNDSLKQKATIDWIRKRIEKAEKSGFTNDTKEEILSYSKSMLNL